MYFYKCLILFIDSQDLKRCVGLTKCVVQGGCGFLTPVGSKCQILSTVFECSPSLSEHFLCFSVTKG